MKFSLSIIIPVVLPLINTVYAHGYVEQVSIAGTDFTGSPPGSSSTKGVVRVISTTSPVKGATNSNLNCGQDATAVKGLATGNPGDVMAFSWNDGDGNWPHNTGPLMTYMAECTNGDCTSFDTTDAKWFKIDEQGYDESAGAWVQATIMNGKPAYVTIPSTLAAGNYIVRHEIIALHLAMTEGGAEFYPSCTQLTVGGSESGGPKTKEEVSFPGAYSDTDAGIFLDAYSTKGTEDYTFPGPDIASFVGSSSSSSGGSSASASGNATSTKTKTSTGATKTSTGVGATSTASVASSSGSCKLKKSKRVVTKKRSVHRPTHYSRVFKGIDLSI